MAAVASFAPVVCLQLLCGLRFPALVLRTSCAILIGVSVTVSKYVRESVSAESDRCRSSSSVQNRVCPGSPGENEASVTCARCCPSRFSVRVGVL
jgi:hypothetical protein